MTNQLVEIEGMMMYRLSNITYEDTLYFGIENKLRVLTEGTAIDFTQLKDPSSETSQYIVKDGDVIIIPKQQNTVYLFGSVAMPGHVIFEPGKRAEYYINKVGGLGESARDDEIMIIKGNTRKWIPAEENPVIEEGDFIYVPRDEPRTFNYYVEVTSRYLGILGSAATVILLLVQFGRSNN
jgi:protein involved in polysaccharide export with SLBB domain